MSNNYAGKFVSAETAVKAVQPGDWVDYGFGGAGFWSFSTVRWQRAG